MRDADRSGKETARRRGADAARGGSELTDQPAPPVDPAEQAAEEKARRLLRELPEAEPLTEEDIEQAEDSQESTDREPEGI
jgi:hypothetical protein